MMIVICLQNSTGRIPPLSDGGGCSCDDSGARYVCIPEKERLE